jgi:hypothetical protein
MGSRGSKEALNRSNDSSASEILVTAVSVNTSTDGAIKTLEKSNMEADGHLPVQPQVEVPPQHSDSKNNKKDKGKHKSKSSDAGDGHLDEHSHSSKGNGTAHKQKEDRECVLM